MRSLIESGEINSELKELILSKKCIVFIGSGLSHSVYDPWPKLVNKICERCGIEPCVKYNSKADELIDAAQRAKLANRDAYFSYLGEHFGRSVADAPLIYDALLSLNFKCYLTTNFDPLLAIKARTAKLSCHLPPYAYPALDRVNMAKRSIHYLHGLIGQKQIPVEGQIVLSRDEFDEAYKDNSNLKSLLLQTLDNENILFIGCSLNEPDIENVFKIFKEHQQELKRFMERRGIPNQSSHYRFILLPKSEIYVDGNLDEIQSKADMEYQKAYYKNMEIETIWYDAYGGDHTALISTLEQIAGLPPITADYSGQGGTNVT